MQCVLRKTLHTTSSVSERGDINSENHSEINSTKTDNNDGYIIKGLYTHRLCSPYRTSLLGSPL